MCLRYVRYDFKERERERETCREADSFFFFFFKSNKNGRRNGKKVQVDNLFIRRVFDLLLDLCFLFPFLRLRKYRIEFQPYSIPNYLIIISL